MWHTEAADGLQHWSFRHFQSALCALSLDLQIALVCLLKHYGFWSLIPKTSKVHLGYNDLKSNP